MGRKRNTKKKTITTESTPDDQEIVTCKTSEIYGRYLEARTPIGKGDLILSEKCLVAGPLRSSEPVCLGCHAPIDIKDPKTLRCSRCSWPICSQNCADAIFHKAECKFFEEKLIQAPPMDGLDFGLIAVLRGLLLKINDPTGWEKLLLLEPHNDVRKDLPLWIENQEKIVNIICQDWALESLFSEDEVHTVCGILEVNAFEMGETFSYRGIFPNCAMLAHNCVPNATQFENSVDGIIEIRAAVDIPAGSTIFLSYAFTLQSTEFRLKMLLGTKFFKCNCDRCVDPIELGSHMNTLICQMCKIGFISKDPKSVENEFGKCTQCTNRMTNEEAGQTLARFGIPSEQMSDIESQEKFLQYCRPIFHATHFIPFGVKFNLCQAYGRQSIDLLNLTQKDLERKSELCSEVLRVLAIICPGYNITRGLVLYEYQAVEVTLARRILESGTFRKPILKRKLQNALDILLESIAILQLAHPSTAEYKMGQAVKAESVHGLQQWISLMK